MAQTNWTQQDFESLYSPAKTRVPREHPEFGNSYYPYTWQGQAYCTRRAIDGSTEEIGYADSFKWITALVSRSIYTPGNKTLIVGCGVGATVYKARYEYPNASIWGTDISAYIQSIKDSNVPLMADGTTPFDTVNRVLNIDITSPTALTELKTYVGGNGKLGVVICELVTETIPDADLNAWFTACDGLLSQGGIVAHIVVSNKGGIPKPSGWPTDWQWKTVSEWATRCQAAGFDHYFIDASDTSIAHVPV